MTYNQGHFLGDEIPYSRSQHTWQMSLLFRGSEYALVLWVVFAAHALLAPYTKVEESFGMQAVHDVWRLGMRDVRAWDHQSFPGVVPRSFWGPVVVAMSGWPAGAAARWWWGRGMAEQVVARLVLAAWVACGWGRLGGALDAVCHGRRRGVGWWLAAALAATPHASYYASRTLPNTFATALCAWGAALWLECEEDEGLGPRGGPSEWRWASAALCSPVRDLRRGPGPLLFLCVASFVFAAVWFRCDVLVLAAPLAVATLATRRATLWTAAASAVASLALAVALSVALDSYLWRRPIWPELQVFLYNFVANKSHLWGVSPWHWYATSALPRALLALYPLLALAAPAALFSSSSFSSESWSPRSSSAALASLFIFLAFVALYSYLPHKELRFLFPGLPFAYAPVALLLAELWGDGDGDRDREGEGEGGAHSGGEAAVSAAGDRGARAADSRLRRRRGESGRSEPVDGKEQRVGEENVGKDGGNERGSGWWRRLGRAVVVIVLGASVAGTLAFVVTSRANYPGGEALALLRARRHSLPAGVVHIDVAAAMTGVTRFGEWASTNNGSIPNSDAWSFSRNESLHDPCTGLPLEGGGRAEDYLAAETGVVSAPKAAQTAPVAASGRVVDDFADVRYVITANPTPFVGPTDSDPHAAKSCGAFRVLEEVQGAPRLSVRWVAGVPALPSALVTALQRVLPPPPSPAHTWPVPAVLTAPALYLLERTPV
jgi:alpha-1,6-mannosyltransferase